MKGDFHVRFCERLKLKCFGLLDRCYLRLQFAISSGFGGRNSVGLLVVILYF
jgi:hypothetical protein